MTSLVYTCWDSQIEAVFEAIVTFISHWIWTDSDDDVDNNDGDDDDDGDGHCDVEYDRDDDDDDDDDDDVDGNLNQSHRRQPRYFRSYHCIHVET